MKNNKTIKDRNLKMLKTVAKNLGNLCDKVVFLGGCTLALFITDLAAPDVRFTRDVDCIVDVLSRPNYYHLEKKLRERGFVNSPDVICRWRVDDMIVDIMPTSDEILGFTNAWYKAAIDHAESMVLGGFKILVVTASYFLATKLEAFKNRGEEDYLASHDLEDILSVIDGRPEIIEEVKSGDNELKSYLSQSIDNLLNSPKFMDALPGHFQHYGPLRDARIRIVYDRLLRLSQEPTSPAETA